MSNTKIFPRCLLSGLFESTWTMFIPFLLRSKAKPLGKRQGHKEHSLKKGAFLFLIYSVWLIIYGVRWISSLIQMTAKEDRPLFLSFSIIYECHLKFFFTTILCLGTFILNKQTCSLSPRRHFQNGWIY